MTVLVTGGAGYIGSHMVHYLVDAGEEVIVVDNLSTGFGWAVAKGARLVVGDVGDATLLDEVMRGHQIEAIIHFAASTVVSESVSNPLGYYRNNTVNSRLLIDRGIKAGVRYFIFSSTCAVYGNVASGVAHEDIPPAPVSPYASSKWMTEIMLRDASAASTLKYVVLRYFNVAGADPLGRAGQSTENATHLVKVAVETALAKRQRIEVYGADYDTLDGTGVRDYVHVSDLAAAHFDALRYLREGGRSITLNCGYEKGHSVLEVIDAVKRISGVNFEVTFGERRAGDLARIVADAQLIRAALGWKPQYNDLDTIVRHSLAWEKSSAARSKYRGTGSQGLDPTVLV